MNGIGADAARVWLIRLGIVIAVALLLGRLGPFGTFSDLSPVERYSYWVGLTLLMWVQGVTALAMLKGAKLRLGRAPRVVIAALLGSIPTAFEVAWSEMLLRVERDLSLVDVVKILGDVCLLSVPLLIATHLLVRSNEPPMRKSSKTKGSIGCFPVSSHSGEGD